MQPGKPTIFNIAGNKVGLSVVPQHVRVAGQTSTTPNKTVMLQGMSPLLHETRKALCAFKAWVNVKLTICVTTFVTEQCMSMFYYHELIVI